jgi:hypothetical protein
MKSRKRRKPKPFRASKEVRRLAREALGAPPPGHRIESPKNKSPKHKKRTSEQAFDEL